jgi:hypothetical protein
MLGDHLSLETLTLATGFNGVSFTPSFLADRHIYRGLIGENSGSPLSAGD